jgi:hypothetical protein
MQHKLAWVFVVLVAALGITTVAAGTGHTMITAKDAKQRSSTPLARSDPGQSAVSAYAFVVPGEVSLNVNPVLVPGRSRNILSVSSPSAGIFCLKPAPAINASTRSWSVTPEASRAKVASHLELAYADAGSGTCPSGQFGVRTYELVGGVVHASEDVAFMVVVP